MGGTPTLNLRLARNLHPPIPMLLFENNEAVFIHIPKTGGTSLRHFVGANCNERSKKLTSKVVRQLSAFRDRWPWINLNDRPHLSYARMVVSGFPERITKNFKILCSVRYPLAWQYSTYRHFLQHHQKGRYSRQFKHGELDSFEKYLEYRISIGPIPQAFMLADSDGFVHCNYFMRLEEIDSDLEVLLGHLGEDLGDFPQLNSSKVPPPEQWSEAAKELCYHGYREDYDFFGYDRDGGLLLKRNIDGEPLSTRSTSIMEMISPAKFDPWKIEDFRAALSKI